jgi:hypothetical protein
MVASAVLFGQALTPDPRKRTQNRSNFVEAEPISFESFLAIGLRGQGQVMRGGDAPVTVMEFSD